jgi:hypothetical protein
MQIAMPARSQGPPTDEVYGEPIDLLFSLPTGHFHVQKGTLGQTVAQIKKFLNDRGVSAYNDTDLYFPGSTKPMLDPFSLNDFPQIVSSQNNSAIDIIVKVLFTEKFIFGLFVNKFPFFQSKRDAAVVAVEGAKPVANAIFAPGSRLGPSGQSSGGAVTKVNEKQNKKQGCSCAIS